MIIQLACRILRNIDVIIDPLPQCLIVPRLVFFWGEPSRVFWSLSFVSQAACACLFRPLPPLSGCMSFMVGKRALPRLTAIRKGISHAYCQAFRISGFCRRCFVRKPFVVTDRVTLLSWIVAGSGPTGPQQNLGRHGNRNRGRDTLALSQSNGPVAVIPFPSYQSGVSDRLAAVKGTPPARRSAPLTERTDLG